MYKIESYSTNSLLNMNVLRCVNNNEIGSAFIQFKIAYLTTNIVLKSLPVKGWCVNYISNFNITQTMIAINKCLEEKSEQAEIFFKKVKGTKLYSYIVDLMKEWKEDNQREVKSFTQFSKLVRYINNDCKDYLEDFNKCLVKQATIPKKSETKEMKEHCKQLLLENQNSEAVLNKLMSYPRTKKESFPVLAHRYSQPAPTTTHRSEEFNQNIIADRLLGHPNAINIMKMTQLYLECIITITDLKNLLLPLVSKAEFAYLIQNATEIEKARRKGTNFVPLNELAETSFTQRMDVSYVIMPHCYASRCNDKLLDAVTKEVLNKKLVSVPYGSQHVNFSIMRKNEFEEELFKNEDEKFQIDHTLIILKNAVDQIKKIEETKTINKEYPLIQRVLFQLYNSEDYYKLLKKNPEIASVFRPRFEEKLKELEKCKQRAYKNWEEIHIKNFHKSLDHRSFYFRRNDKKFNCIPRWQKEVEFRSNLVVGKSNENKEGFNENIRLTLDSFQNVTRQKLLQIKQISIQPKTNLAQEAFPSPPQNKVLFVMEFGDQQVLRDINIVLYQLVNKKNLLQYLLLKMFNLNIKKIAENNLKNSKAYSYIKILDNKLANRNQVYEDIQEQDLLIPKRDKRKAIDENQEFQDLIQYEIPTLNFTPTESVFEGPEGNVFIGTKSHYYFVRFLLTIYQRVLKAKEMKNLVEHSVDEVRFIGDQRYEMFKALLIFKYKDIKFEDYLRKIYGKNAFLFFTLDKLLTNIVKLINNLDDLSTNIIKQDTKDYELEIKKWEHFKAKSETSQLARLYRQNCNLFRFNFSNTILHVSSWTSVYRHWKNPELLNKLNDHYSQLVNKKAESKYHKQVKNIYKSENSEYYCQPNRLLMHNRGQQCLNRRNRDKSTKHLMFELEKRKKIKLQ